MTNLDENTSDLVMQTEQSTSSGIQMIDEGGKSVLFLKDFYVLSFRCVTQAILVRRPTLIERTQGGLFLEAVVKQRG